MDDFIIERMNENESQFNEEFLVPIVSKSSLNPGNKGIRRQKTMQKRFSQVNKER